MDMPMPSDPALANLPLSDPRCNGEACTAFAAAANLSQEITPWAGQFEYGHWLTWYYLIIVFLVFAAYGIRTYKDHQVTTKPTSDGQPSRQQKLLALGRSLAYRRFSGRVASGLELPSFGVLALLLMTVVFIAGLTFIARPYYRLHVDFGSPPVAIRAGLMAFACTPILIALAGKANIITLLTGISHEKLNVVHRWVGWFMLVLSLIHTIPFFYEPLHDAGYTDLYSEFYDYGLGSATMYSGVPPLAILVALVLVPLPFIRKRFYETFYYSHVLMAITYVGLLFWHAGNLEDSWAYLWATIALWLASYLARVFWFTRPLNVKNEWFVGAPTRLQILEGGMTRIEVYVSAGAFRYTPSQHCFVRFPDFSPLDNHPFTLVSVQNDKFISDARQDSQSAQRLLFLARTHHGFTRRLSSYCESHETAHAWIDGPYGGVNRPIERLYDQIILVCGGSGITACVPWLELMSQCHSARVKKVSLCWAIKSESHISWVRTELEHILASARQSPTGPAIDVNFFVTGTAQSIELKNTGKRTEGTSDLEIGKEATVERDPESEEFEVLGKVLMGRPMMSNIINERTQVPKTFVFGCGPESMRTDLSNAVASAQKLVIKGEMHELALHLEAFGW